MITTHDKGQATQEHGGTLSDRLRELVAAIDRRVPHIERQAERRIAQDSGLLKKDAQDRLARLETACSEDTHREAAASAGAAAASDPGDLARMDTDKG
jgi:hypothetical protein